MTTFTRPSTVLVLGANGRFGAVAAQAFAHAGWTVLAQARREPAHLPAGARHLAMGLDDVEGLVAAARGSRTVVYAVNPPYTRWSAEALPLATLGMDIAARLGATFLLPGNVYNFGAGMPAVLAEDTAQRPTERKGAIRCAMEAELEARASRGLRSVVLRAGDFFGGGTGSWLDLVIAKALRAGRLTYPGPLDRVHAWAYLPDLARAAVALAGCGDGPAFARFHFEGHTLTGAELLDAVERAAIAIGAGRARPLRRAGMPWALMRAGGLVVPMWREIAEMRYLWDVPHALDGRALRAAVGRLPETDLDTAMVATLRALGHGARTAAPARAAAA